jgi:hypothetical protein
VQKLLAVANAQANDDESDAFSKKAAEFIARYRLSPEALRPKSLMSLSCKSTSWSWGLCAGAIPLAL